VCDILEEPGRLTIGSPYARKSYDEIVENILDIISKGIAKDKHTFKVSRLEYDLSFTPVDGSATVQGIVAGKEQHFLDGSDFVLVPGKPALLWTGKRTPDKETEFKISYKTKDHPSSMLTDTSVGSVLRTLVEAVSKELEYLYKQIDNVYKSSFVDTATGRALDGIAALVGVRRKPPTGSTGLATFWRESDPQTDTIKEKALFDGREYVLNQGLVKTLISIKGKVKGFEHTFTSGSDFDYIQERNSIIWKEGRERPDADSPYYFVEYVVYKKIGIDRGTILETLQQPSGKKIIFVTTHDATLQKDPVTNRWKADVQIRSMEPGPQTNVSAGSIITMQKPPSGVEHVMNFSSTENGSDDETDEQLRGRVKTATDYVGRATIGSLRSALDSIEGLQSPPIVIDRPDKTAGLVHVIVDGGDLEKIKRVIESTRAAGIKVEPIRPDKVDLDLEVRVLPTQVDSPPSQQKLLKTQIEEKIRAFLSDFRIGDDLVYNQIVSSIMSVPGVRDVTSLKMDVYRKNAKAHDLRGNVYASQYERLYPLRVTVNLEGEVRN
jgi:uncharacterized phage protein gp47/JayE